MRKPSPSLSKAYEKKRAKNQEMLRQRYLREFEKKEKGKDYDQYLIDQARAVLPTLKVDSAGRINRFDLMEALNISETKAYYVKHALERELRTKARKTKVKGKRVRPEKKMGTKKELTNEELKEWLESVVT